jgi:hypothetical protein
VFGMVGRLVVGQAIGPGTLPFEGGGRALETCPACGAERLSDHRRDHPAEDGAIAAEFLGVIVSRCGGSDTYVNCTTRHQAQAGIRIALRKRRHASSSIGYGPVA